MILKTMKSDGNLKVEIPQGDASYPCTVSRLNWNRNAAFCGGRREENQRNWRKSFRARKGTNMNSTQMASSLYPETMNKEDN